MKFYPILFRLSLAQLHTAMPLSGSPLYIAIEFLVQMRSFHYHPEAAVELSDAAVYIETEREGYGVLFLAIVQRMIDQILETPHLFPLRKNGVRFCHLGMFRYQIVFCERGDDIVILAVAHTSRRPGYWRTRL